MHRELRVSDVARRVEQHLLERAMGRVGRRRELWLRARAASMSPCSLTDLITHALYVRRSAAPSRGPLRAARAAAPPRRAQRRPFGMRRAPPVCSMHARMHTSLSGGNGLLQPHRARDSPPACCSAGSLRFSPSFFESFALSTALTAFACASCAALYACARPIAAHRFACAIWGCGTSHLGPAPSHPSVTTTGARRARLLEARKRCRAKRRAGGDGGGGILLHPRAEQARGGRCPPRVHTQHAPVWRSFASVSRD